MRKYEIRDCLFGDCSQAGYEAISGCYTHCQESFAAKNDKQAIEIVKRWQELDDDEARAVIEYMRGRDEDVSHAEQAYDNAPCYVACLYSADTGKQVEF